MTWPRKVLGVAFLAIGALSFVYAFNAREPAREADAEPVAAFGLFDEGLPIPVDLDLAWSEAFAGIPGADPAVARRTNDREHLRDLLLQAVLTAWGGDPASVALALHDENGPREPYLNTTAQPQHGPTRHAVLEDGVTVLLIPSDATEAQRHDWIAQTTDLVKVKTTTGPSILVVFEYCIDDPIYELIEGERIDLFATLRRAESVPGDALFTEAYGYVERTVSDVAGLDGFLSVADDLIAISPLAEGVKLSGRAYRAREHGRVTSQHVATLWNAYGEIDAAQDRRSQRLGLIVSDLGQKYIDEMLLDQQLVARLKPRELDVLRGSISVADRLQLEEEIREQISQIFDIYGTCEWERVKLYAARTRASDLLQGQEPIPAQELDLIDRIERSESGVDLRERSLLRGSLGFSLDTEYHYDVLIERFDAFMAETDNPIGQMLAPDRQYIRDALGAQNSKLLLCLIDGYRESDAKVHLRAIESELLEPAKYQIARYDGGLQGTEVGQILFLTDLLAKLLDFDFNNVYSVYFPDEPAGWVPSAYVSVPEHYMMQLEELPGTRIWFSLVAGSILEGDDDWTLRFPHVATRVFALGQATISGEVEQQPGYMSEAFVHWFNNNYDEVASVETAYDQLNQIVKWSYAADKLRWQLSFLETVPVSYDHYFPEWARAKAVTGVETWVDCFHPRGSPHESLETMSVFHTGWEIDEGHDWCDGGGKPSALGLRQWVFQGGVSLPRAERFAVLRPSALELGTLPPQMRRISMYPETLILEGDRLSYARVPEYNRRSSFELVTDEAAGTLTSRRTADAVRQLPDGTFMDEPELTVFNRGFGTELVHPSNQQLIDHAAHDIGRLVSHTSASDVIIARSVVEIGTEGIRVGTEAGALRVAGNVGRRLSRIESGGWRAALTSEPRVEAFHLRGDGVAIMRIEGRWLEMSATPPRIAAGEGTILRASAEKTLQDYLDELNVLTIEIRAINAEDAAQTLSSQYGMALVRTPRENGSFVVEVRGPPRQPPTEPPGPPPTTPEPERRPLLLIGGDLGEEAGAFSVRATDTRKLAGVELDRAIDAFRSGDLGAETGVLQIVDEVWPDLAPLYAARKSLLEEDLTVAGLAGRAAEHRAARLKAVERALDDADFATAARLDRDLVADFGPLNATERQVLFTRRYAARAELTKGIEKDLDSVLMASEIGGEARTARAYVDILTSGFRSTPETVEALAHARRVELLDMAGGGRHVIEDGEVAAVRSCFLREVPLAEIRGNAVVYMSPDAFQTGNLSLPLTTPGLKAFRVEPAPGARDLSGVLRPDRLRIGQRAFRIHDGAKVPSIAEAVGDPAKADALALYIEHLLVLARDRGPPSPPGPDGGADVPPAFVLTGEDELHDGSCFLVEESDEGEPVQN